MRVVFRSHYSPGADFGVSRDFFFKLNATSLQFEHNEAPYFLGEIPEMFVATKGE